jgi:hypothetical protein
MQHHRKSRSTTLPIDRHSTVTDLDQGGGVASGPRADRRTAQRAIQATGRALSLARASRRT